MQFSVVRVAEHNADWTSPVDVAGTLADMLEVVRSSFLPPSTSLNSLVIVLSSMLGRARLDVD